MDLEDKMRLSNEVVQKIIEEGVIGTIDERELRKFLMNLDLVVRDSSQSVLVENK